MKVKIDIECTPEEARAFFGLPDVRPLQDALMKEMQDRMTANLRAMDPETLFKIWMPAGIQGWDQLQKVFWRQFGARGESRSGESKGGKKDEGA